MKHVSPIPDLSDIQGNILRGYPSFKFSRFMLFRILSAEGGRQFLDALSFLVTPGEWGSKQPVAAVNVGLSFAGLEALRLPYASLASFPVEFQEGMKARAGRLGDDPNCWEPPWNAQPVHVVVMVYAVDEESRQRKCKEISGIVAGVNRLDGEPRIEVLQPQDCQWLTVDGQRCRKEHFGFDDGISNPDVEGVPDRDNRGGGNPDDEGGFRKVPVGEFILGYPGEGGEVAPMPLPHILGRNGAYLVMRKLQQHVGRFRKFTEESITASRTRAGGPRSQGPCGISCGEDGGPLEGRVSARPLPRRLRGANDRTPGSDQRLWICERSDGRLLPAWRAYPAGQSARFAGLWRQARTPAPADPPRHSLWRLLA